MKIKELKNNYGFFIVGCILLYYFITLFIFIISSYGNYKNEIKSIILALKFNEVPINRSQIIKKPMKINKNMKLKNKNHFHFYKKNEIKINQYNINIIKNKNYQLKKY